MESTKHWLQMVMVMVCWVIFLMSKSYKALDIHMLIHARAYSISYTAYAMYTDLHAPGVPDPRNQGVEVQVWVRVGVGMQVWDDDICPCHGVVSIHRGPQDDLPAQSNKGGIRWHLGAQLPACTSAQA